MTNKYRIVKFVNGLGQEKYHIQKRIWWIFWKTITGISEVPIHFAFRPEAVLFIQKLERDSLANKWVQVNE